MRSNPLLDFVVEAGYDPDVANCALVRFSRGGAEATLDQAMEVRAWVPFLCAATARCIVCVKAAWHGLCKVCTQP